MNQKRRSNNMKTKVKKQSTPPHTSRQHEAVVDTRLQELATATKGWVNEVSQAMASNLREMGGTIFERMLGNRQSTPSAPTQAPPTPAHDLQSMGLEDIEISPQAVDESFHGTAPPVQQTSRASSSTPQEPPPLPRIPLFKTTLDNHISPAYWTDNPNLTVNDIKFQLYLRGVQVPEESEIQEELKHKGRGKARTYK